MLPDSQDIVQNNNKLLHITLILSLMMFSFGFYDYTQIPSNIILHVARWKCVHLCPVPAGLKVIIYIAYKVCVMFMMIHISFYLSIAGILLKLYNQYCLNVVSGCESKESKKEIEQEYKTHYRMIIGKKLKPQVETFLNIGVAGLIFRFPFDLVNFFPALNTGDLVGIFIFLSVTNIIICVCVTTSLINEHMDDIKKKVYLKNFHITEAEEIIQLIDNLSLHIHLLGFSFTLSNFFKIFGMMFNLIIGITVALIKRST